jgi:Cu/Zn superoxide dismutase
MAAVAVFDTDQIVGNTIAKETPKGVTITATFTKLPPGKHGFHIHTAGDLRAPGCAGACSHFHIGALADHGDRPSKEKKHNKQKTTCCCLLNDHKGIQEVLGYKHQVTKQ